MVQAVEAEVATLLSSHADKLTDRGHQRLVRHRASARARGRRRFGAHPLFVRNTAALRAPLEEPRSADPDPLPQGRLHRRLRGGAPRAARQGRRRALGLDHRAAQGRLVGRARALEQARSLGQALQFWVDGIHVQARLEDAAQCLLVIIGATPV